MAARLHTRWIEKYRSFTELCRLRMFVQQGTEVSPSILRSDGAIQRGIRGSTAVAVSAYVHLGAYPGWLPCCCWPVARGLVRPVETWTVLETAGVLPENCKNVSLHGQRCSGHISGDLLVAVGVVQ